VQELARLVELWIDGGVEMEKAVDNDVTDEAMCGINSGCSGGIKLLGCFRVSSLTISWTLQALRGFIICYAP
jgi:hypothetical protein